MSPLTLPPPRVLGFFDLLGFKSLIDRISSGETDLLERLLTCILWLERPEDRARVMRERFQLPPSEGGDFQATVFSDCVVISDRGPRALSNVVFHAGLLAGELLEEGILCRGGIAQGWAMHNDRHVVGKAMVDAYQLEQRAHHPRIIIDPSLSDQLTEGSTPALEPVSQDEDGTWYVDVFEFFPKSWSSDPADIPLDPIEHLLVRMRLPLDPSVQKKLVGVLERGYRSAQGTPQVSKWEWLVRQMSSSDSRRESRLNAFERFTAEHPKPASSEQP
jgi:hypothetical protein